MHLNLVCSECDHTWTSRAIKEHGHWEPTQPTCPKCGAWYDTESDETEASYNAYLEWQAEQL